MSTLEQNQAAQSMVIAIAETVREVKAVPSGALYSMLAGKVSLNGYEKILALLTRAGLIDVSPSHMIRWTGPNV